MKRLSCLALLVGAAACGGTDPTGPLTPPSPTPPSATWGVPITGGTMMVSTDGKYAIVSDPDRDRIAIVDLAKRTSIDTGLTAHDEPGRVVEDAAGRFHVALRRGGAIVDFDSGGHILGRRAVCAEPRGIAYDASSDSVHVACTSGELVTFPAAGGAATRKLLLDRDLRDIVVTQTGLLVSRFRTAQLIELDAQGAVVSTDSVPDVQRLDGSGNAVAGTAAIAWRTIAMPDGTIVMSHQRQVNAPLHTEPGGYGGMCGGGPVESALAVRSPGGTLRAAESIANGALPVDLAVSNDGAQLAVVVAGADAVQLAPASVISGSDQPPCGEIVPDEAIPQPQPIGLVGTTLEDGLGAPSSVAFDSAGNLLVYYPEYPGITVHQLTDGSTYNIQLSGGLGYDSGRELFHTETQVGLACASCHPEGRDDGLTWLFADLGLRRTQSVAGHIMERAPYHWAGDMPDLSTLMDNVFTGRMEGPTVTHSQKVSLGPWLETIQPPAAAPVVDPAAVARGGALFASADTQCTTCHSGPLLTNKAKVDVGTGGLFEVPSLISVGARPPFLHTGCAATLADRFGSCGGGDHHGHTSQLSAGDISDLVAYLETL
nr:hypothetical protein [Kofleriaceae bacterium]